jgi:AbrB family looped-hinge helix DNA binding protein
MKRTYAIQENGQVTLPQEWREKFGLKKGDLVSFSLTEDGRLIVSPRVAVGLEAMDKIAEALKEQGLSLDEILASGEEIRQEIYDEQYGKDAGKAGTDA